MSEGIKLLALFIVVSVATFYLMKFGDIVIHAVQQQQVEQK